MTNNTLRVLSGDIGGTKTRLAIFDMAGVKLQSVAERSYPSGDFATLDDIIEDFIAAGTGLGEAGLYRDGDHWRPFATEGGHTDFSPGSELEIELLRFLMARHGHVSWERLLSGPGLVNIHDFLVHTRKHTVPGWLRDEMQSDPAAAISRAAQSGRDALCVEALELFVRLYGVEAGNLALKMMASGGMYLGGGIAPKILDQLESGAFMAAFRAKGRMQGLLDHMPVRVILNDRTALYGPAVFAGDTRH